MFVRTCMLLFVVTFMAPLPLPAQTPEKDMEALQNFETGLRPWEERGADGLRKNTRKPTGSEVYRWEDGLAARRQAAALKFMRDYPDSPLRWVAAAFYVATERQFIEDFRPGFDEAFAAGQHEKAASLIVVDTEAREAWRKKAARLRSAILAAADAPPDAVGMICSLAVMEASRSDRMDDAQKVAAIKDRLLQAVKLGGGASPALRLGYQVYFELLLRTDPAGYAAELKRVLDTVSGSPLESWVAGLLRAEEAKDAFDMKFTALDGREVDLARLRGKVVLIDFWATWCGPCIAELPHLKHLLAKYEGKGLAIVGVALDQEKDRAKLEALVRQQGLPWPQHFDGKGQANEFAVRYGVRAIPEGFLIDRDGRLAGRNMRGDVLDAELTRIFGF